MFERLKMKQAEILSDLEKSEKEQINSNNSDQAAELLLASISACMIKRLERVAPILKFDEC